MAGSRMLRQVNKRKRFNIILSVREIEGLLDRLPEEGEVYKFLSTGGFSSISFVRFIAKRAKILELTASTLRVGKKEMQALNVLHSGVVYEERFQNWAEIRILSTFRPDLWKKRVELYRCSEPQQDSAV